LPRKSGRNAFWKQAIHLCIIFPPEDVKLEQYFIETPRTTFCEWKGAASYCSVTVGDRTATNAAWFYRNPTHPYEALANHVAFYRGKMDACYVDGEQVQAQEGDFYGGWITTQISLFSWTDQ
jgi:uncharacterized protein (DUF427 family)